MRKVILSLFAFMLSALPAISAQQYSYEFRAPARFHKPVNFVGTGLFAGVQTFTLAPVLSTATITVNGDTLTFQDLGNANVVQSEGTQTINGAKTFGTPIASASINDAAEEKVVCVPFRGLAVQALDDSTVFTSLISPGRAGVVTQIDVAAITPPVGGTNTVMVKKNNATDCLAANFDPTTLTTVVASKPALHGTAGNYAFTATDTLAVIWTAGAQSTDAVAPTVTVHLKLTDL